MKLSAWAKSVGLSYRGAYELFRSGRLPARVQQLSTGTILVFPEQDAPGKIVIYARVSSHDQVEDLQRQLSRLRDYCAARCWVVSQEITEIGSGLNGRRKKLLSVLADPTVSTIVVEHRERLARFGVGYIEAIMKASGRQVVVLNETECNEDLVQDFVDVVTSMCAKIYGRRSAKNRAKRAVRAAADEDNS